MAKFKIGDRVRLIKEDSNIKVGTLGTVVGQNGFPHVLPDKITGRENHLNSNTGGYLVNEFCLELVTDTPTYKPITPKVGERYRVLKRLDGCYAGGDPRPGDTIQIRDQKYDTKGRLLDGRTNYLTTEYLELVEEPKQSNSFFYPSGIASLRAGEIIKMDLSNVTISPEPIKQSITTKAMNFIKSALLSKEDKTLIKAGYLHEDLSLTSTGKSALEFITFTANKKQLVTMAEEALAEEKE